MFKQYYWVLIIIVVLGGGYFWRQHTQTVTATPQDFTTTTSQATTSMPAQGIRSGSVAAMSQDQKPTTAVIVDIKGAVRKPGLYHLQDGDRMADLLKKAGGMTESADAQQVNLAQKLQDQSMIYIPEKGEIATKPQTTTAVGGADGQAKINLNTATLEELQQLDGIGAKKAEKIIDYRENQGQFQTPADLGQVNGFGEKTVARLQEQITV